MGNVREATLERIQMVLPYFPLQIEKQPVNDFRNSGFPNQKKMIIG